MVMNSKGLGTYNDCGGEGQRQFANRRNYCHQNIAQARRPERHYVDTKKGDAHALQSSGLELHHTLSKTFRKIPNYQHHHQLQAEASEKETN
jgi:hypothetical protein